MCSGKKAKNDEYDSVSVHLNGRYFYYRASDRRRRRRRLCCYLCCFAAAAAFFNAYGDIQIIMHRANENLFILPCNSLFLRVADPKNDTIGATRPCRSLDCGVIASVWSLSNEVWFPHLCIPCTKENRDKYVNVCLILPRNPEKVWVGRDSHLLDWDYSLFQHKFNIFLALNLMHTNMSHFVPNCPAISFN